MTFASARSAISSAEARREPRRGRRAKKKAGDLSTRAKRGTLVSLLGQFASQALRLSSNLILTRLLDPDAFGLMAIVLSVTGGLALISDVGVWQAIVSSPRGDDEDFLDSAWTFHSVRGVGLFLIGCLLAYPASLFYGRHELLWLLPLASLTAIFSGVESTRAAQATRHMRLGRVTAMELITQGTALVVAVSLGCWFRSVVALVVAALVSSGLRTILSHTFLPGRKNRLRWTPEAIDEILKFGRFIFLSTIFFFAGQRYDVFALGRLEGMTVIGVYWQAVNIVSVPTQMVERVSSWVLMPALAESFRESHEKFVRDLRRARLLQLPAASVLFLGAAMTAPAFFRLVYRDVYADAGWMVQLLILNAWCMFMLEATSRALLALGETAPLAIGNGTRLVVTVVCTMIGFSLGASIDGGYGPLIGFMLGNAVGAFAGNLAIAQCLVKHGVDVRVMDIVATVLFVVVGAAACFIPHLVERATGAPAAYTTLVGVVVVIAPLALYVRSHLRAAHRG